MKLQMNALAVCLGLIALVLILAGIVKWRGFRASSTPSDIESAVTRSVRNFAIPGFESRKTNPFSGDSVALQQGRDAFLSRCASCHGVDGRGMTPIGTNEYPRVPDLHSDPTQSLTDGDIHYIIENGVQLTGMPAMHSQSSSESWKLVSYIRSLRSATREAAIQDHIAGSAHYVGSESCRRCHAEIYERWKKTPMANVVRDPKMYPDAIIPDLSTNNVAKFTVDQVAFVYGSKWKRCHQPESPQAHREGLWMAEANRSAALGEAARIGESGLAVHLPLCGAFGSDSQD
jgi:mono/diheme cytochrome c family protein